MAKCPNCGITVAFHGAKEINCYNCNKRLKGVWEQHPGHLGKTVAVVVKRKRRKGKTNGL